MVKLINLRKALVLAFKFLLFSLKKQRNFKHLLILNIDFSNISSCLYTLTNVDMIYDA